MHDVNLDALQQTVANAPRPCQMLGLVLERAVEERVGPVELIRVDRHARDAPHRAPF